MFSKRASAGGLVLAALILGLSTTARALSGPPFPVIFIHGLNSSADTWQPLGDFLLSNGWTFGGVPAVAQGSNPVTGVGAGDFYRLNFSDSRTLVLEQQAVELSQIIDAVLTVNGASKVFLVGHSTGGLAARQYLEFHSQDDSVAGLTMIGAPHQGSEFATLAFFTGLFGPAVQELRPDSDALALLNANVDRLPGSIRYLSIVVGGKLVFDQPGDGIVTERSQNLADLPGTGDLVQKTVNLTVQRRGDCGHDILLPDGVTRLDEVHTCETGDPGVGQAIVQAILEPALTLALNGSAFAAGDPLDLSLDAKTYSGGVNTGDLYLGVQTPDGRGYVFDGTAWILVFDGGSFLPDALVPLRVDTTLTDSSEVILSGQVPESLPPGPYTFLAALVRAGTSPIGQNQSFAWSNFLSNLAATSWSVLAPPGPYSYPLRPTVLGAFGPLPLASAASRGSPGRSSALPSRDRRAGGSR